LNNTVYILQENGIKAKNILLSIATYYCYCEDFLFACLKKIGYFVYKGVISKSFIEYLLVGRIENRDFFDV